MKINFSHSRYENEGLLFNYFMQETLFTHQIFNFATLILWLISEMLQLKTKGKLKELHTGLCSRTVNVEKRLDRFFKRLD
jgi:surface polysaccharide O-acyltransferase-like enzyme